MIWHKLPVVRLLLPLVFGIIFGIEFQINSLYFLYSLVAVFILLIILTRVKVVAVIHLWGYILNVFLVIVGFYSVQYQTQVNNNSHFKNYSGNTYKAKIVEPVVVKEKSVKLIVAVNEVYNDTTSNHGIGKVLLYLKRDSLSEKLCFEDEILLNAKFDQLNPPQNPEEFDYRTYLSYHNINYQKYIQPKQWKLYKPAEGFSFLGLTNELRKYFLSVFDKYRINGEELAVTSALVLGHKENLSTELAQSYSSAGAMHVLAVSGLHVGIIYVIFNSMLFFFGKSAFQRTIKAILLISFLWFYAALTGMSPSVMRAATMFTAVVIGAAMNYKTSIYNTLAASAMILLLINPYLLVAVGFQLSYLAVLGIVFLQPKIYNLMFVKNWLLDKIWVITSVSIAAQIATFPLGLFYFHQFPNYFLVSNLIVIPFATLILYVGLALLITSPFPIIAELVSWLLVKIVAILNWFVKIIEWLPYSMTQEIHISKAETILFYITIFLLILLFTYRRFKYLFWFLSLITVLVSINIYDRYISLNRVQLVIYNVKNTSAINFIKGTTSYLFTDSLLLQNESKQRFHIKHYWWRNNIKTQHKFLSTQNIDNNELLKQNNFYKFQNFKILQLGANSPKYINASLNLDYLIISDNYNFKTEWLKTLNYKMVIFDSSNKQYKVDKWIKDCKNHDVKYYSVIHSGAFVKEL